MFLFFGTSLIPTISSDGNKSDSILIEDDFNDNIINYSKWHELYAAGTWEETNQRCEFSVMEGGAHTNYEGINSTQINVQLTNHSPLIASCDFITNIGSSSNVGHLWFILKDEEDYIKLSYLRWKNEVQYDDGINETVLCSRGDGTYNAGMIVYLDRYKVWFDSVESEWIYNSVFSEDVSLEIHILLKNAGTSPSLTQRSAFDNVIVRSVTPIIDINQGTFDRGFPIHPTADGNWGAAQSFTPTVNTLTSAELYLRKMGDSEFLLTVELREDYPEGTLLDSKVFTQGEVPSSWEWFPVDFEDVTVTPDTDYFVVIPPAPLSLTPSFGYEWGYAFGDQYSDGAFWFTRDSGGLWRDLPTMYEFCFRTFGYN
jgi:hypothetical protein